MALGRVHEFPPEMFVAMQRLMVEAPFRLIRASPAAHVPRGYGRVVNISSAHGLLASPFKVGYVTAKHALEGHVEGRCAWKAAPTGSRRTASIPATSAPRWSRSRSPIRPGRTASPRPTSSRRCCCPAARSSGSPSLRRSPNWPSTSAHRTPPTSTGRRYRSTAGGPPERAAARRRSRWRATRCVRGGRRNHPVRRHRGHRRLRRHRLCRGHRRRAGSAVPRRRKPAT